MQYLRLVRKPSFLILLSIVTVIIFVFHHKKASTEQNDTVYVEAESVKQNDIPILSKGIGTLTAAKKVDISPEIAGQVAKILVSDGAYVTKGTPLIQLNDASYQAKLKSDKANLLYSETDYRRKALLGKQGAISKQMIDAALADLRTKQADVEQSQVNVAKMQLTAPFDGMLGKIMVSPGDYVATGQKLVSLTDIDHLRVEYSISEKYFAQVHLGQEIKITTSAYPNKIFMGKVAFISPTINTEDRTISLYAEVPNSQHELTAGLFVNVTHALGIEPNALLIPASSLVPSLEGQKVFKIINKKAYAVPVTVGQRDENSVEIINGLNKNDFVVTAGQEKLKEGSPIEMRLK